MRSKKNTVCMISIMMIVLILDAKTALAGAAEGIDICIKTVIPSLFPFFFLTGILTNSIEGYCPKWIRWLGKSSKIPYGAEYFLLIGAVGGYPVGAQSIYQAYKQGDLKKKDAERMLCFCNNAGPAFIFGMAGQLFTSTAHTLLIWIIQILSALLVSALLPGDSGQKRMHNYKQKDTSISEALINAIKAISIVCGWIIIFRILCVLLRRWILWILPVSISAVLCGILELSNGCIDMASVSNEAIRFIFTCGICSFGGCCVALQISSIIGELSIKSYIYGKLLQSAISVILAVIITLFLFPGNINPICLLPIVIMAILLLLHFQKQNKISSGNSCSIGV